ncbi:MAG: hypothetical protein QXW98_05100 [Candidatus Caldarchaeum sp.]
MIYDDDELKPKDEENAPPEELEVKVVTVKLDDIGEAIESKFSQRCARRRSKEAEWAKALDLYLGNLGSDWSLNSSPQSFYSSNSRRRRRPSHNIVRAKCDIAISQNISIQFAGGNKNWDIHPSPVPNIPPEEAAKKAALMEQVIEDQLNECKYPRKIREAIYDRVIYGTGIIKCPVNTPKIKTTYVSQIDPLTGTTVWVPSVQTYIQPSIERVDPWMFFPDDSVNDWEKCEDCIEVHLMTRRDLLNLIKNPGFIGEKILEAMKLGNSERYASYNIRASSLMARYNPEFLKDKYVVLEYHGPVKKEFLDAAGVDPGYESPLDEYYAEIWVFCGKVIRFELSNLEGDYELPYAVCTWIKDPSSVFGFGVPIILEDQQRVVNAAWQMILDNASASAAPMLFLNKNSIEPADGEWQIGPGKIYYITEYGEDARKAVQYIITPNASAPLMEVLNAAKTFSEEESSIPLISAGLASPQMTQSATGLALAQKASTSILDYMAEIWDDQVTEKVIERFYRWNMQYNPDDSIKGDFQVDVKSSTEFRNNYIHLQNLEKLAVELYQNPTLASFINQEELTRARLSLMSLPNYPIVKSDVEIQEEKKKAEQNKFDPKAAEFQLEQARLQLEAQKHQDSVQLELMKAQILYEREMLQAYAAMQKEMSELKMAQAMQEVQLLKLLMQEENKDKRMKIEAQLELLKQERETELSLLEQRLKELELKIRERGVDLQAQELGYAFQRGKGI